MKKLKTKTLGILVASILSTTAFNAHAEAVTDKMNLEGALKTIQANTQYNPQYAQQGCSEAAWLKLQAAQIQALKEYQTKMGPINQQILKAGTVSPSSLGVNGCLSSIDDIMSKYTGYASKITDIIGNFNSASIGNLLKGAFSSLVNKALDSATEKACTLVNNSIAETEAKIFKESGLGNILDSGSNILNNPFGIIDSKINQAIDTQINKALDKQ